MTLQEITPMLELDVNIVVSLFMGKEEMYLRYLRKYPDSAKKILLELTEAVELNSYQGIEASAHGLKGVSSNLGLKAVTEASAKLVQDVRNSEFNNIEADFKDCCDKCELAIHCIFELE